MKNLLNSVPESYKRMISAAAPLVVVIILFIFVGKFGISKVVDLRSQINSAQSSESILTQKLNLLQTISSTVSAGAGPATSAVPDANPSLSVISQLKTLAIENGVSVSGIKSASGAQTSGGLNGAMISFTADGMRAQIFDFLAGTLKIAPITIVDKIRISEAVGSVRAEISLKCFWADFPKTIPSIDAPVSDLTAAEKDTLSKISGLIQPAFTQPVPSQGGINPNPFGQ